MVEVIFFNFFVRRIEKNIYFAAKLREVDKFACQFLMIIVR